MPVIRALIFCR